MKKHIETVAAFDFDHIRDNLTEAEREELNASVDEYRTAKRTVSAAIQATVEAFEQSGKPSEAWAILCDTLGFDEARETVALLVALKDGDGRISERNRAFASDLLGDLRAIENDMRKHGIYYPDRIHPANFDMIADAARKAERPTEPEEVEETAEAAQSPEKIITEARYAAKSDAAQKAVDELVKYYRDELAIAEAWKGAKVKKTKSGEEFAQLGRACEGCAIGKYYPVEEAGRPWLSVFYRDSLGRYTQNQFAIHSDDMSRTDYREFSERWGHKYGIFNADACNEKIRETIEYHERSAAEYLEQIKAAPAAIAEGERLAEEVAKALRAIGGKEINGRIYPSSLQYLVRDAVKTAVDRADIVRG